MMSKIESSSTLSPTRIMLIETGKVFCIIATLISIILLLLRQFNYSFLLKLTPAGSIPQDPLASVCFIIIGIILYILRNEIQYYEIKYNKLLKIVSFIPLVVSFIGFLEFLVFILQVYFKVDIPLLYLSIDLVLGRMAPNTSFCFILLGVTIFYIDTESEKRKRVMQFLNYAVVLIALLAIYGYIYKVEPLYYAERRVLMSFHSSACFLFFSSGVLFLRPDRGSMHVLLGENPQEVVTLRFIAIVLPLFFGWLKIQGENAGLFDKEFGTALFAIANFIIIMVFLGRKSTVQYRLRKAKAKIQEVIKEDNERQNRILNSSPTFISIYDLESEKMIYTNRVIAAVESFKKNDALDMSIHDFIKEYVYKDDIPLLTDRIKQYKSFEDNKYYPAIYRLYGVDGDIRWLYSRAIVYKRVDGEVKQILINNADITEQKKAEEELIERRKFIQKITDTSANVLYIFDLDAYKSTYVNRNIETLLGYTLAEIESLGSELIYSLMHPDDIDKLGKYYAEFKNANDDEVREIEYRIRHKLGNWIWIYSRDAVFLKDEKGEVKQIVGVAHDITKRKEDELEIKQKNKELNAAYENLHKAQHEFETMNYELEELVEKGIKQLRESQEKYRAYIRQSNEGIWRNEFKEISYVNINLPLEEQAKLIIKYSVIAECNDRMATIHGYESGKELIGMVLSEFLLMTESEKMALVVYFIKSGYRLTELESVELTKEGDPRYYRGNMIGIVEDGKLLRIWGTQQDITDHKLAEDALKESEERYRYMADRIPEIFWSAEADGVVQYYNQKWYDYTGDKDKHRLKDWKLFIHADDENRVAYIWRNCIKHDKECYAEYRLRRFDGIYRWHLIRATPVKNKEGKVVAWMSTSTDIHEQKVNSDELQQINANLNKITHDVSDDLKETISSVENLISIRDGKIDETTKQEEKTAFETTKKSVDKLKKIIANIPDS